MNNKERERFEEMVNNGVEDLMYEQSDEQEPTYEEIQQIRKATGKDYEVFADHKPHPMTAPYEHVDKPSQYIWFDMKVINVIKKILTHEQYKGFLMGTSLHYRFRCGSKKDGSLERDIEKAKQYEEYWHDYVAENRPHA